MLTAIREAARECARRKRAREFHIGDLAVFTSKWAKSQRFPEGTVHLYGAKGRSGIVVGTVGNEVVVRNAGEFRTRYHGGPPLPGTGYGDFWARRKDIKIVRCGKGPPAEAWAMPPRKLAEEGDDDIETILQGWAESKGLVGKGQKVPPFDIEEFIKGNPFIEEPKSKQEWRKWKAN